MDYRETIITGSDFTKMGAAETKDYIAHVLCLQGSCSFVYNGERYDLLANNLLIVRQHHLIKDFSPHDKGHKTKCNKMEDDRKRLYMLIFNQLGQN